MAREAQREGRTRAWGKSMRVTTPASSIMRLNSLKSQCTRPRFAMATTRRMHTGKMRCDERMVSERAINDERVPSGP